MGDPHVVIMPQAKKISGKFYPLKSEEWLDSINQLTHSELKILYYVRSLDPYNNGINLTPAQIARDLSTEKTKMHRSTVGRALKTLDRKGFINMELLQVRIKVSPKGCLSETEKVTTKNNVVATQQCCDQTTDVVTTQHSVPPHNLCCDHATDVVTTQQSEAETQSEQGLQNPKTLKNYSDFKRSLSENERENFFSYVEEKTKNLSKPINDLEAWLASKNAANQNRWEAYYNLYQTEELKRKAINESPNTSTRQLTLEEKLRAIANFQNRHNRASQEDTSQPVNTNSEEARRSQAAFDELLSASLGEKTESLADRTRRMRREAEQKRQELARQRREAAEERAKQQNPDQEQRKAEMLRQVEEFNQRQHRQNPENNQ